MKILGANPLLIEAPAFPVQRGIMVFPRKPFAAAGHIHNATPMELVGEIFSTNSTWRSPETTSRIVSMRGWGGAGQAAYNSEDWYYSYRVLTYRGGATNTIYDFTYIQGYAPGDSCTYYDGSNTTNTLESECTYYVQNYGQYFPEVYGGDTTAFGKVFYGGYGYGTTPQYVDEPIAILPATDYQIIIPSGGYLHIMYYK